MKEKFWHRLCEALGRDDLRHDPRFETFEQRYANRSLLVPVLAAELGRRSTGEWLARLRGRVPVAPVYTVDEALADEQALARDLIIDLDHPVYGRLRQVGSPIKFAGVSPVYRRAGGLGEHTEEILALLGGFTGEEVASLRRRGIV
jgi:crotonobetainyl-CoA:carnitine CoA-transferase CaiB-like acyl-CoA transferase